MDKLKSGRLGGAGLSLFESMRDEAAEAFVSRLGLDGGAQILLSTSGGVGGSENGATLKDSARRSRSDDLDAPKPQVQTKVLSPGLVSVPISSTIGQRVRLDQNWEQTFSPPKYTRKMRREREAEILRQRMLLSDYTKMQMHLDSQYSRFQVAMKNEERQMNKWKDALGHVRLRVEKHGEQDIQELKTARQARWDNVSERVDGCLRIIEQTAIDNDEQHQQSVAAIEQHEQHSSQVRNLMLQNTWPANAKHHMQASGMPLGLDTPNPQVLPSDLPGQMAYLDDLADTFAGPVPYRPANGFDIPGTANGWDVQVPHWQGQELGNGCNSQGQWHKSLLHAGIGMLLAMDPDGNCIVDAMVSRVRPMNCVPLYCVCEPDYDLCPATIFHNLPSK